jgi:hypothetical protein
MRFHKGSDGWGRGSYQIPQFAVIGASDCGSWSDSPAPTDLVYDELERFRVVLRKHRIRSRLVYTTSGNAFMLKRWVVVHSKDFAQATTLATEFLAAENKSTHYVHDAA